jgi:twitching motility protein PilT
MHVNDLLKIAVDKGASDLHLKVGAYPMLRLHGALIPATEEKRLTHEDTVAMAQAVMSTAQRQKFNELMEIDIAYGVPQLGRFRCNIYQQRGTIGLALRVIPMRIKTVEELGLPAVIRTIAEKERGLVLVTGTTGSGKSTTLAAMVDHINHSRNCHVMTIEDPIEFLHRDYRSVINQREVAVDTQSFGYALRSALRQDPDVILVGEMRDLETVKTALTAAETGHLVFSTLHTISATDSINRIIDFFPPHEQRQVRMSLAGSLRGIVSQRLVERRNGGRVPAVEILVATGRIFDKIVNAEETHEIEQIISEGEYYGMQTFDQSLPSIYGEGLIELREALAASTSPHDLRLMIEQFTMNQASEQAVNG